MDPIKARIVTSSALAALMLATAACGSKKAREPLSAAQGGVLILGASISLSGGTAKEGGLTKEGYEVCQKVINDKGGFIAGGTKYTLEIRYGDDTSKQDVSAELVDQFNDQGIKLIL